MFDRLFGKLGTVVLLGIAGLLASGSAVADFPSTSVFPNTGAFQARLVKDKSDVAVIELTGSYDRDGADKSINIEPRTVVAREFYRTHQDRYDFVVVFSNFEFNTGDALAFHIGVRNQVKGLGMETFDNSAFFGSQGKLQGYIDMAALSRYVTNPYDARFDTVLQVFAHEFMHQWGAKVRFRGADGNPSSALLGKDGAHWSFLLDSGASVEYGNQWRDNANGSFTSVAGRQFFSPLDLYLMGMYRKAEVPPFFLIDNPEIDPARLPLNGVTITGTRKDITVDDVVAVEGPREPDAANAQKEFRLGFVLLSRPGTQASDADIAAVNTIRRAIATRLGVLTGGRAIATSYLESTPAADAGTGATPGGTVRDGAADLGQGLAWLRGRQSAGGEWKDNPFTAMRDTTVVFDTLVEVDGNSFTGREKALAWIGTQAPGNTDYLARQVRAVNGAGGIAGAAAQRLLALQNTDGGWGVAARYASNALDTALALQALLPYESTLAKGKLDAAANFLTAQQNRDGGWGNLAGGASRTAVSSTVLQAIKGRAGATVLAAKAIAFLATRQHADGGFGDSPSTIHDTANVMAAMLSWNALGHIRAAQATAYIASSQQVDGSWDGSVYSTALALRLLKSSGLFNWTASELKAVPAAPLDGQQVVLTVKVANSGTAAAPAGIARAFDGDPANGGRQIGADLNVPPLVVGDSIDLQLLWPTLDQVGAHTIVVLVDPDNAVPEASKADNRVQANVTVRDAPVPVDLVVNASDVTATPATPNQLPSVIAISAQVANIGRTDATNVRVVLRQAGPNGALIDEKTVNLLGRTRQVVNFATTLTRAGLASYTVTIDPDARITEADKTNNSADVSVETVPAIDVEVRDAETTIARNPVYIGADATFATRIRNSGTQDTPPFKVRYFVTDGTRDIELASRVIQLAAGADSQQDIVWRPDAAGQYLFKVVLDTDNLLTETSKANNAAQLPFAVTEGSGINLSVAFKDFVVDPVQVTESREVRLSQTVRNSGNAPATNVEVGFYDGDPAGGHLIGALQTIPLLAAGDAVTVQTTWTKYPDAGDHLVFFVADPANKLADLAREDNSAFIVLTPNSMLDLAISAGDVQVAPELPRPADPLRVSATVSNLGKQAASNVVVRAFDGDPAAGGRQVGADQVIAALPGLSAQTVAFAYPASGVSGARTVVIVVDPDNRLEEKTKDNNQARRDLNAQDGNFYVTNRYFSPNGDGVKDDTALGFRLAAATDVTVDVVAKNGKLVHTISNASLKNVTTGLVVWDGLNTRGSVVPDGDYALRVMGAGRTVLGEATVTLDTNRSSILKAADTPFALFTNLTCNMTWEPGSTSFSGIEDRAFLSVKDGNGSPPDGLYAMSLDAGEQTLLLPRADRGPGAYEYANVVSLDGRKVAYNKYVDRVNTLWVMDADGSNKRALGPADSVKFAINADGSAIVIAGQGPVIRVPTDGGPRTELLAYDGSIYYSDIVMAPDGKTVLVKGFTGDFDGTTYRMVDVASGRVSTIPAVLQAHIENRYGLTNTVWAPNAKLMAISGYEVNDSSDPDAWNVWVVDTSFNIVSTLRYQPAQGELYLPISMTVPTWNSDSSEFAYEVRYCTTDGFTCWNGWEPSRMANAKAGPAQARSEDNPTSADSVVMVANVARGVVELVESSRLATTSLNGSPMQFLWVPNERTVLRSHDGYSCEADGAVCTDVIDLDDHGKVTPVFNDWRPRDYYGNNPIDGALTIDRFLPASTRLSFSSGRAATDPASSCYDSGGTDQYIFSSMLNLTADLRVVRSATATGLVLRGTAADANFARYTIEYATTEAPNAWKTVAPASGEAVSDGVFMTWVPPAFGKFRLRLTVEDLAGNKRQVIRQATWNDAPPITDLYKDAEFMSPNGDGVKEGFTLHYHVAAPVHLVFNIYDNQQTLVRSVSRDHYLIGADVVFNWDGRDDRGRTVPDGQYRITVLDYEFFVTIDTAAPLANVSLSDAYTVERQKNGDLKTVFAPVLRWSGSDANLDAFAIERGTGETPSDWSIVYQRPGQKLQDSVVLKSNEFVNQHYRAVLEDKAGNHVVAEAPLGAQQVFLTGYANHIRSPGANTWQAESYALYPTENTLGALPRLGLVSTGPLRLRYAESLRRPVARVLVQYHLLTEVEKALSLTALDTLAWEEALVPAFLQGAVGANDFLPVGAKPLDHEIMFAWDQKGIVPATDFLVRIKVIDEEGTAFFAMAPSILRQGEQGSALRIVTIKDQRSASMTIGAELLGDTPASNITLLIQSTGDPRFAVPRVVHTVGETRGGYEHYLGVDALASLDLRLCESYTLSLRAVLTDGTILVSPPDVLPSRCMNVDWIVTPEAAKTCNVPASNTLNVQLLPHSSDGRKLTQLLFGQIKDGHEVILNNWNDPVAGQTYAFDLDAASMPAGVASFFARIVNEDGRVETTAIAVPVAHAAAVARITYPVEGQKMCGIRIPDPVNAGQFVSVVGVEAAMSSDSNVVAGAEYAPAGSESWTLFNPLCDGAPCAALNPVRWANLPMAEPGQDAPVSKANPGQPAWNGNVGNLGLHRVVEGDVSVRLRIFNGAGQQTCTAPVTFAFDSQVHVGKTVPDRVLFSPRAEDGNNRVSFSVTPEESVTATLRLYVRTGGTDDKPVFSAMPGRTLFEGRQLVDGVNSFEWDGKNDDGSVAADGQYQLVADYTDSCGNIATHKVQVELDATAPLINLAAPQRNGQVGLLATVSGTVRDKNLVAWFVEFALPASPDQWTTLASRDKQTGADVAEELAAWNTLGLTGPVTLRVRASDRAGNASEVVVPLTVVDAGKVISYMEAVPPLFSPDGDGNRDSAAVRFGLLMRGKVTLTVHRETAAGPLVRTLAAGLLTNAGAQVQAWDGKDDQGKLLADGVYAVHVSVSTVDDPVSKQEESILVTLDNTRPEVTVDTPVGDFAPASGNVTITARDQNFAGYQAYLSRSADLLNWQLLGEGTTAAANVAVLDLATLPEGKYAIKVVAQDGAGNSTELVKRFDIDNTAPLVTLSAPLAGSYLSARLGLVPVAGTVVEKNGDSYALRYGQGTPDASWPTLVSGATLAAPLAFNWDVSRVADGAYTLQLSARDRAGLNGAASVNVIVDNTPPRASITTPAQGAYVRGAGNISGVAFDANLQSYTLEIAAGTGAAATRWSPLGTATTSVTDGTLLDWQALPADGSYTLRLKVTDKAGASADAMATVIVDTQAPAAPLTLAARLENRNDARLTWNASPESDLAGYALYRDGTRINVALLTQNSFTDPALANGSFSYAVTAIDKAGWESPRSNLATVAVDATGPSARIVAPVRGALVGALVDIRGIASAPADFKEYRLYIGAGDAPSAWRLLRRSPAPVRMDTLASWDTAGLAENAVQTLKLEAEDLNGTIVTDSVTVTVDNTPPPAPLQLTAQANSADVTLRWTASAAPDLAGYIVLRDERIANAPGPVVGSWKPWLVTASTHIDLQVADGVHRYTVVAMDRAENISAPSNTASVTIDTRAPHAVMVQPLVNAHIGRSTYLLATTVDTDVAAVRFQYRPSGAAGWIDVGAPATALPYAATLDGSAFTAGDYQLRAVATDAGGRTDPAPTPVTVTFSDTPDVITDLKAAVNGGDVTLTWSSAAPGLTGYVLERYNAAGGVDRIDVPAQARATWVDSGLPDFRYRYRVSALGASGTPNMSSDDAIALVHTPRFAVPFTPTAAAVLTLTGKAAVAGTMTLATSADVPMDERVFATDADGNFQKADIAVPMGYSSYALRHADADGNLSKPAVFEMQRGTPPAMPTGLHATLQDGVMHAGWDANTEADLFGYRVVRNGAPLTGAFAPADVSASSNATDADMYQAIDGDGGTWWSPDPANTESAQWLTVQYGQPVLLSDVLVTWAGDGIVAGYDLQIPAGAGNWATLASVRGNTQSERVHPVPQVLVSELRIRLVAQATLPKLAGITAFGAAVQTDPALDAESVNATESLQVFAVNGFGMESAPAQATATPGDVTPAELPDLVVDPASVTAASDNYHVGDTVWLSAVLANAGAGDAVNAGASMTVVDAAGQSVLLNAVTFDTLAAGASDTLYGDWTPTAPGDYTITVVMDDAGTVAETNEANNRASITLTVLPAQAGLPIPLTVTAPQQGSALQLNWTAPVGAEVSYYRIRSAPVAEGPYATLADWTDATDWLDETAINGVPRFYIASAFDAYDHLIGNSAPTAGVAEETALPATPVLVTPTRSGTPVTVGVARVDIGGNAGPGASVELLRAGAVIDMATASTTALRVAAGDIGYGLYDLNEDASLLAASNGTIVDTRTGVARAVPALVDVSTLRWSHGAGLIGVVARDDNFVDRLRVYSAAANAFIQASTLMNVQPGIAWSQDDRQIAAAGNSEAGESGLWLFDRVTGEQRLLLAGAYWNFGTAKAWTPDGQYLALVRNSIVEVVRTSDGSSVFSAAQASDHPSWSADGKQLIYQAGESWTNRSIAVYTREDGNTRMLTDGAGNATWPLWSGPDGDFTSSENGAAVLRGADGVFKATLGDGYSGDGRTNLSGMLWYADGTQVYRFSAPGSFSFFNVGLQAGANLFSARATNANGKTSALSPAISITLADGTQPDLAAAIDDITVLPAAPLVGEATRITATVRNRGASAAQNVTATLALRSAAGSVTTLTETTITTLGAGASRALTVDWTPPEAGQYSLVLVLDASDTVHESNESNNTATRTIVVASSALPALAVTLDAAVYSANAAVAGKVTLSNAGPEITGTLALRIEDLQGYLVATLPPVAVTLPYGQGASYPANWNTGAILAGDYRLVAQLLDTSGAQLAIANAGLRIGAAVDVGATVAVEFARYQQQATASIAGTVTLAQGNAGLDDASALIQVQDSTGRVVFESHQALGAMLPGASANVAAAWPVGASAVGDYRVTLEVRAGAAALATAQAAVAVVAATPVEGSLQLAGTLSLNSPTVAIGDRLTAAYTIRNLGAALAAVPLTVRVVNLDTQAQIATATSNADLKPGATFQGVAQFAVDAWPLATLQVVLSANVNGPQVVLQRTTLRVIDRTPPVATFALAAQSGALVAGSAVPIIVKAIDSQSLVTRVEYSFGTSAWTTFALESQAGSLYRMSLAGIADGPLQILARAFDAAGNQSDIAALNLVIDNTAPAIQVAGVADGATYPAAVTPVVTVQDAHLQSTVVTLDGAPFVSGTPVTSGGAHVLHIDALDVAGNASARSVNFQIAQEAAPVLVINSPAPGALMRLPFTVAATATSAGSTIAAVAYRFDGGTWLPAAAVASGRYEAVVATLADGRHTLAARATDATGQVTTTAAIDIEIDNTPPVIVIGGVVEGAIYEGSVTPVVTVTDAHPDVSTILLDGFGIGSGQAVTAIGSHVLVVNGVDKLANKSSAKVNFTIRAVLGGSLVAAPKPVVIGAPLTLAAMVSNGGAGAISAVQYRVVLVDVASGKVLQQFDDSGALAPAGVYQRSFTWTATGAAGTVVRATLTATVGADLREIGSDTVTLAEAPVRLSGAVAVAPKEVASGAVLAITRTLVNSGAAQNGIALQLTIVDGKTGAVVFTHDETVNLAANASWTGNLGWTASGAAGTGYLAKLTATAGGKAIAIGQDSFIVTAPVKQVDISFGSVPVQKILVLSLCRRAASAGLGTCGATPIVAEDATVLGRCDTARALAVSAYLGQIGVSNKVVTSEADFAREIRAGGYTGYWISGGGTRLRQPLQAELNAGLQLGESLLADGLHDLRGSDRALQELLSVYVSGPERDAAGRSRWSVNVPAGTSGTLQMSGDLYPVNDFAILGDKILVDAFENAKVEALIRSTAGADDGHHHGHGIWHFHHDGHGSDHGSEDIHRNCVPETSSRTGIVRSTVGAGHTLFLGFDWVASWQAGAANARWLDVGRTSFDWLRAVDVEPGAALVAGDVVTRKIALHNSGAPLTVKVVAVLPKGAKALVTDPVAKTAEAASVVTVTWQLNLAANEARDLTLQMKLPRDAGMYALGYTVTSETAVSAVGSVTVLGRDTIPLQVNGVDEWAAATQAAVRALDVGAAQVRSRDEVLRWIDKAVASNKAGDGARALRELVMAQSHLDNIAATPIGNAQLALARTIRALERRQ